MRQGLDCLYCTTSDLTEAGVEGQGSEPSQEGGPGDLQTQLLEEGGLVKPLSTEPQRAFQRNSGSSLSTISSVQTACPSRRPELASCIMDAELEAMK